MTILIIKTTTTLSSFFVIILFFIFEGKLFQKVCHPQKNILFGDQKSSHIKTIFTKREDCVPQSSKVLLLFFPRSCSKKRYFGGEGLSNSSNCSSKVFLLFFPRSWSKERFSVGQGAINNSAGVLSNGLDTLKPLSIRVSGLGKRGSVVGGNISRRTNLNNPLPS